MSTEPANPYAPPKAEVDDVVRGGATAPPLWNPGAAAGWSLLFSPIFGAALHMKNWKALGEPQKAAQAKLWIWATLAVFVVLGIVSALVDNEKAMDVVSRAVAIGLLVSWYASAARHQTAYVAARFGKAYPHRGWTQPLLLALLALVGFIVAMVLVGVVIGVVFGAV